MAHRVSQPLYKVKLVKNVMIPMRDGVRLAADLIMPDSDGRFPGVIQYHPYRKDDVSIGNNGAHHFFAERGYVGIRLDVRGTGSSEGQTNDEYSSQEMKDGFDAINWLAKQGWCTGKLGMFGYSYSGTSSITAAMQSPEPLKAIAAAYFADDRYAVDTHYAGGSLMPIIDCGLYGPFMTCFNAMPTYPEYSGDKWLEVWRNRLEKSSPWPLVWLEHSRDSDYWREASVKYHYDRVKAPTFLIDGWRDGYPGASIRVFENLRCPKRLLIGPWMHVGPDQGIPGPNIHINHELLRWWDYWLKGIDSGVMDEPPISFFVQRYDRPSANRDRTTGSWRFEKEWPIKRTREISLFFGDDGELSETQRKGKRTHDALDYRPEVGLAGGIFSTVSPNVLPTDQRPDEALSLSYTTEVLEKDLEVTGFPRAVLHVSSTATVASFVVRLSDVAPDGMSALVSKGVLNATRRKSLERPEALVPGKVYELEIPLEATSWVFEKGHRIRVALSNSDWPNMWPTPEPATNRFFRGEGAASRVTLPVVSKSSSKGPEPSYLPPPPLFQMASITPGADGYKIVRDLYKKFILIEAKPGRPLNIGLKDIGADIMIRGEGEAGLSTEDPASAFVKGRHTVKMVRKDCVIDVTGTNHLLSTEDDFHLLASIDVKIDGSEFFSKSWSRVYKRDLM